MASAGVAVARGWQDTTGDGKDDTLGLDTDGDGKVDAVAADTTGDGQVDSVSHNLEGGKYTEASAPHQRHQRRASYRVARDTRAIVPPRPACHSGAPTDSAASQRCGMGQGGFRGLVVRGTGRGTERGRGADLALRCSSGSGHVTRLRCAVPL